MSLAYKSGSIDQDIFRVPDDLFCALKSEMVAPDVLGLGHGDFERWLTPKAREVFRELYQSYVTLRGQEEALEAVIGADGIERTHVRHSEPRRLETSFGSVTVSRTAYSGRQLSSLHPVDGALNLPAETFSHEVQRVAVLGAVQLSYDRAAAFVAEVTSARVAKRQLEGIVGKASVDFEAFYEMRRWCPDFLREAGDFLVLSFDEKGIVVKRAELRAKTRRIAERGKPRLRAIHNRNGKKNWRGRKRMATVGVVYSIGPDYRTPVDVRRGLQRLQDATRRRRTVRAEHKRVFASVTKCIREVVSEGFDEAMKRDPEQTKKWLVLIDGDPDLRRAVLKEARKRGVQVTLVLDVIHALQYLWRAGEALCGDDSNLVEPWVLARLEQILAGKVSDVVSGMRGSATKRKLKAGPRKAVDKCAKYFLARKSMMGYGDLLTQGAPISTGAIEGSCKHLINDRCDLSGARWTIEGAEAILRMRAIYISGDFDQYWKYHEERERIRNHESRYRENRITPTGKRRHLAAVPRSGDRRSKGATPRAA